MKKIMIAAIALAMGVSANAASIAWKFNTNAATWNGYTVYAISAVSDFENVDAIKAVMLDAGSSATIAGSRSYVAAGGSANSSWKDGDTINFYYAIVDKAGENYWVTGQQTATAAGTGTPTASIVPAATGAALLSTPGKSFGGPGPDPTPEPTSGLLLLLGVAGLALRRKQA